MVFEFVLYLQVGWLAGWLVGCQWPSSADDCTTTTTTNASMFILKITIMLL